MKTPDAQSRTASEPGVDMSPVDSMDRGWITGFMRGLQPQRAPASPSLDAGK